MARVTVEDCVQKVKNRFELCLVSAQRARDISSGAELTVDRDNDKNPVVALREIADETISTEELKETLVESHQKYIETAEDEDHEQEILAAERELAGLNPDEIFSEEQVEKIDGMGVEAAMPSENNISDASIEDLKASSEEL